MAWLCDEIFARLDSAQKESEDTRKLFDFALENISKSTIDVKLKIRYIHLKLLLQSNQDGGAYELYQTGLPTDYPLLGYEYFRLASFLIASIDTEYALEAPETLHTKACLLLYKAHLLGDEKSYNFLTRLLREQDSRSKVVTGKHATSSMQFFNPDDTESAESYERKNKRLIDDFVIQQQKQKEAVTTKQKKKFETYNSSLMKKMNDVNFIYRFIVSFSSDKEKTTVDHILTELDKGECLSDIVKKAGFQESDIPNRLKAFIETVLVETQDLNPFRAIELKNGNPKI